MEKFIRKIDSANRSRIPKEVCEELSIKKEIRLRFFMRIKIWFWKNSFQRIQIFTMKIN